MASLLHIDASLREEKAHSRHLTQEFGRKWQQATPSDTVAYRGISRQPVPHIDEPWSAASYMLPAEAAIAAARTQIAQLVGE